MDNRTAGAWLRQQRKAMGMTMADLHKASHIGMTQLSQLENGKIASPSAKMLCQIAEALHVTPNQMAAEYGYWDGGDAEPDSLARELERAGRRMRTLPKAKQAQVMATLDVALRMASGD